MTFETLLALLGIVCIGIQLSDCIFRIMNQLLGTVVKGDDDGDEDDDNRLVVSLQPSEGSNYIFREN